MIRLAHLWPAIAAASLYAQAPASTAMVRVPATSNPYLAGMPPKWKSSFGDRAPEQSPVLVELSLVDAAAVTFAATGAVNHLPVCPPNCDPPAGSAMARHTTGAENGISDIVAPMNSLLGVFLNDAGPDRRRAPKTLDFFRLRGDFTTLSPQLKQLFFIGTGMSRSGVPTQYVVPQGATRLYLGVMDGHEWNNNTGAFSVRVTIQRTNVSSNMFSVDSSVSFAKFACMPDRSVCTPDRETVEEKGGGQYHIVLPAFMEWGASIAARPGVAVRIHGASGTSCLPGEDSCGGPAGNGKPAGEGYLAPDQNAGALVMKRAGGRAYFSVNGRSGATFQKQAGYFEFDVTVEQ